ncbi:MAG: thioredoxin family protein [bacterium]|nr:thioredoxin family protein [bacterium]
MKYYILLTALTIHFSLAAQVNQEWIDKNGNIKLLGEITSKRLNQKPFKEWYKENYNSYSVQSESITNLKTRVSEIDSVQIFMGTWCGDSKRGVPQMLKVFKDTGYEKDNIQIIAVDRSFNNYKQSPGREEAGLNIHRVPTLIAYQNGEELGRIVENPKESWEKDLLNIVNKNYEPNYAGVTKVNQVLSKEDNEIDIDQLAKELKPLVESQYELNTYGYQLLTSWNIREALTVFEINCKVFENEASVHYTLAKVQNIIGQDEEAIKCLNMVLEIEPEHEDALALLTSISPDNDN